MQLHITLTKTHTYTKEESCNFRCLLTETDSIPLRWSLVISLPLSCNCSFLMYTLSFWCHLFISTFHLTNSSLPNCPSLCCHRWPVQCSDQANHGHYKPKTPWLKDDRCVVQMPSQGHSDKACECVWMCLCLLPAIAFCLIGKVKATPVGVFCKRETKWSVVCHEHADHHTRVL